MSGDCASALIGCVKGAKSPMEAMADAMKRLLGMGFLSKGEIPVGSTFPRGPEQDARAMPHQRPEPTHEVAMVFRPPRPHSIGIFPRRALWGPLRAGIRPGFARSAGAR